MLISWNIVDWLLMEYQPLDLITVDEISAVGVPSDDAERLCSELAAIVAEHGSSGPETWKSISRRLLSPDQPFAVHQMMYYGCYKGYYSDTPPAWIPDRWRTCFENLIFRISVCLDFLLCEMGKLGTWVICYSE